MKMDIADLPASWVKKLALFIQKVITAGVSDDHPDYDPFEEDFEARERERLQHALGVIAAVGASLEGFLTATEAKLADPIEQKERERQRAVVQETAAILEADYFADLRQEICECLGQESPRPLRYPGDE
jgi:hypothetical protein